MCASVGPQLTQDVFLQILSILVFFFFFRRNLTVKLKFVDSARLGGQ